MSEEPSPIIYDDGRKVWYVNGKRHRVDGPAYEWTDGTKWWFLNGKQHRSDGPAVERTDGSKAWWVNGERHRLDGPAVEWTADGTKEWWVHGALHRFDGPAVEYSNGDKEWWVNNKESSEVECMAAQSKIPRIQRWWRNHKLRRFVRLTTKNKQFIESFFAPEGKGGLWHKRKMMSSIQKLIE